MPQNYTKMWDAFLGGEWAGETGTPLTETATSQDYLDQTRAFYSNILGEAFDLPGFGETDLAGAYAAFSNVDLETAERTFRSEIGDPYGGGVGDPFSWEKVSRYNTEDPAGVGRLQDLLEDQLYGQGKFLGGQAGADYGTATSKELETYTTGMTGEREELTYGALTSGVSLASGRSGATIRSGEGMEVAEDVLIEAYKKAKTLGSDYRAGSELVESDLEGDLNEALTTYLDAIDEEKERWFSSVMGNVRTFKRLEMEADLEEGETYDYQTMTDEELEAEMDLTGGDFYNQWTCGYGQTWDATLNDGEGGCKDTTGEGGYEEEVAGYQFRDDEEGACGIGMIWDGEACIPREELELKEDDYGLLCPTDTMTECWNGAMVCNADDCSVDPDYCESGVHDCAGVCDGDAEIDALGVCGGYTEFDPNLDDATWPELEDEIEEELEDQSCEDEAIRLIQTGMKPEKAYGIACGDGGGYSGGDDEESCLLNDGFWTGFKCLYE